MEPRKYRFRFLNGSNSRFYNLQIAGGPPFHHIGSEGGMFDRPVQRRRILMLPAERADVIVDFSGFKGRIWCSGTSSSLLALSARRPAPPADHALPCRLQGHHRGPATIPKRLPGSLPNFGAPERKRYITLEEVLDEEGSRSGR